MDFQGRPCCLYCCRALCQSEHQLGGNAICIPQFSPGDQYAWQERCFYTKDGVKRSICWQILSGKQWDCWEQDFKGDNATVPASPTWKCSFQFPGFPLVNFSLLGKQQMMAIGTGFLSRSCLNIQRLNNAAFSFDLVKYISGLQLASAKVFRWVAEEKKQI